MRDHGRLRRRIGVALSNEDPLADTLRLGRLAQALGFDEVWVPESGHGRSVTSVATALASATTTIGLGIGVVNPFWRHPSLIAMEAATIDEVARGRLRLGLGAAVWTLRALGEGDGRLDRPLTATVDALRIVRALLAGDAVPVPTLFPVREDARLDVPARAGLPLYVGAVNGRMLRASGAVADGVYLGAITSPGYTRWARGLVDAGAREAGRDPAGVDLIANVLVSVADDRKAARRATLPVLAYYLHRVEGVVVDQAGADPDAVAEVRRAVRESGVEAAAARVSDGLVDVFAAAGSPDEVVGRLDAFAEAGLRAPLAWHVFGPDKERGLRLLAGSLAA